MSLRSPGPIVALLAVLAGICASVLWIDQPLARGLAKLGAAHAVFTASPVRLPVMIVFAYVSVAIGLGHILIGRRLPKAVLATMLAGIALLISLWLTHEVLKPLFGRTIPSVYLRTGHSGFHWLHRGVKYASFPSGHATQAGAILSVFWALYPRGRPLYALAMLALAFALMLGEWHYLGDILAGGLVGAVTGTLLLFLWRKCTDRPEAPPRGPRRRAADRPQESDEDSHPEHAGHDNAARLVRPR